MSASAGSGKPRTTFRDETLALIRRLASEGLTSREIAARIGTTPGSLRVTCARKGIRLRRPQAAQGERQYVSVRVPVETHRKCAVAAERRACLPEQLISAVLHTIAGENLFDAVLDGVPAFSDAALPRDLSVAPRAPLVRVTPAAAQSGDPAAPARRGTARSPS
jgi:hypothetical protein